MSFIKKIFKKPSPIFNHWQSMIVIAQQVSCVTLNFDPQTYASQVNELAEQILASSQKKLILPFDREDITTLTQSLLSLTIDFIKANSYIVQIKKLPLRICLQVLPSSLDLIQMVQTALGYLEKSVLSLKSGASTYALIHEINTLQHQALALHIESTHSVLKEISLCEKEILNAFLTTWQIQKKILSVLENANKVIWDVQRIHIKYS